MVRLKKTHWKNKKKHCQCSYRVHGTRRKPKLKTCQRIQRSYPSFDAAHYFPWNDVFTLFTKQPNALRFIWVANPFFKLDRRSSASSEKETTVERYQNSKWREVARRRFKAHTPWLEAHSPGASQAAETGGRSRGVLFLAPSAAAPGAGGRIRRAGARSNGSTREQRRKTRVIPLSHTGNPRGE